MRTHSLSLSLHSLSLLLIASQSLVRKSRAFYGRCKLITFLKTEFIEICSKCAICECKVKTVVYISYNFYQIKREHCHDYWPFQQDENQFLTLIELLEFNQQKKTNKQQSQFKDIDFEMDATSVSCFCTWTMYELSLHK